MGMRASKYTNKKKEEKASVMMTVEEARKVIKGDKDTLKTLQEALKTVVN